MPNVQTRRPAYITLILAFLHGVTGVTLLVIASWFIAISAVALPGFNYVIPAVVIRALALLRIASGYGSMWVGHNDLLTRIASTRLNLFKQLHNQRLNSSVGMTEALAQHTEALASKWIAWVAPLSSVTIVFTLSCSVAIVMGVPGAFYLCLVFVVWLIAVVIQALKALGLANEHTLQSSHFRQNANSFLKASAIWHLYSRVSYTPDSEIYPTASALWRCSLDQKKLALRASWWFQGVAYLAVVSLFAGIGMTTSSNNSEFTATLGAVLTFAPIAIVIPMVLLASPDWVSPSFLAIPKFAQYKQSEKALKHLSTSPIHILPRQSPSESLILDALQVKGRKVSPTSATLPASGVVVLKGPSGSGKSTLLQGIAGLLPSTGHRQVDGVGLPSGVPSNWIYVEQEPIVLAASIQMNLDVAGVPYAKRDMQQILCDLGLESLALNTWVGKAGRSLSGGERKRLALGRAVLAKPSVLLIDEPFEGLDAISQQAVCSVINAFAQHALVIVASHVLPKRLCVAQTLTMADSTNATITT